MTQYPNEKDPHSNWLRPPEEGVYPAPAPAYPPPMQDPCDGAPAPAGQSYAQLYATPQGLDPCTSREGAPAHDAPPPPQGYYPAPQGPPPDYGYAQSHPDDRSTHAPKETWLSPPSNSPYAPVPVPDVDVGPSTPQQGQGGFMMSLGAFFGNKGPPPMWRRQPPQPEQLPYGVFPPMCLVSNDKNLTHGFPELPPPCQLNPHPFATHDVTEEDWRRCVSVVITWAALTGSPGFWQTSRRRRRSHPRSVSSPTSSRWWRA